MKYLIIKYDEIKEDGMLMNMLSGIEHYDVVLSEEETLAKFKEVWDEALKEGAMIGGMQETVEGYEFLWDRFKETL